MYTGHNARPVDELGRYNDLGYYSIGKRYIYYMPGHVDITTNLELGRMGQDVVCYAGMQHEPRAHNRESMERIMRETEPKEPGTGEKLENQPRLITPDRVFELKPCPAIKPPVLNGRYMDTISWSEFKSAFLHDVVTFMQWGVLGTIRLSPSAMVHQMELSIQSKYLPGESMSFTLEPMFKGLLISAGTRKMQVEYSKWEFSSAMIDKVILFVDPGPVPCCAEFFIRLLKDMAGEEGIQNVRYQDRNLWDGSVEFDWDGKFTVSCNMERRNSERSMWEFTISITDAPDFISDSWGVEFRQGQKVAHDDEHQQKILRDKAGSVVSACKRYEEHLRWLERVKDELPSLLTKLKHDTSLKGIEYGVVVSLADRHNRYHCYIQNAYQDKMLVFPYYDFNIRIMRLKNNQFDGLTIYIDGARLWKVSTSDGNMDRIANDLTNIIKAHRRYGQPPPHMYWKTGDKMRVEWPDITTGDIRFNVTFAQDATGVLQMVVKIYSGNRITTRRLPEPWNLSEMIKSTLRRITPERR